MANMKRKDAWKPEEDKILAETVIETVKGGGTQILAFDLVSEKIGRTPASVQFRWNSFLRKKYVTELAKAREFAKEEKRKTKRKKLSTEKVDKKGREDLEKGKAESVLTSNDIDKLLQWVALAKGDISHVYKKDETIKTIFEKIEEEGKELTNTIDRFLKEIEGLKQEYLELVQLISSKENR